MKWRLAESLKQLRAQINALYPNRSKVSDGSIGDSAHKARIKSDHNPNAAGVVCAIDITHDPANGVDCEKTANLLVKNKDPRIKYLIWNKRICSSKVKAWQWRPYAGANAHRHHLHISVDPAAALYDEKGDWKLI